MKKVFNENRNENYLFLVGFSSLLPRSLISGSIAATFTYLSGFVFLTVIIPRLVLSPIDCQPEH